MAESFGDKLRWWRQHRGLSQLALASRAEISQRHLGFLELGRALPTRGMVLRLTEALDVPLRQQNALLIAAGFAPVWRESRLEEAELMPMRQAVDLLLSHQEPFPGVAVDRHWNLLKANTGAVRLVEFLVGPLPPGAPVNLAHALVAPDVLRPFLVNWMEVVRYFVRSVQADASADGAARTAELYDQLLAYAGVREVLVNAPDETPAGPVLPMHFRKGDIELRLFTTIATIGTPQDITLQELRIECFFPLNESTATVLRGWSGSPQPST